MYPLSGVALFTTPSSLLLAAAGIDRSRVEDMEQRLKRDVLREAQRYDNYILVTEEDDDMNVSVLNSSGSCMVSCMLQGSVISCRAEWFVTLHPSSLNVNSIAGAGC